jgi:hypothetical protein
VYVIILYEHFPMSTKRFLMGDREVCSLLRTTLPMQHTAHANATHTTPHIPHCTQVGVVRLFCLSSSSVRLSFSAPSLLPPLPLLSTSHLQIDGVPRELLYNHLAAIWPEIQHDAQGLQAHQYDHKC